jgi:subtilisin family serine protease
MEKAITDGVDVISMSLGAASQFEKDGFFAETAKSANAKGIAIVAANGNFGAQGLYFPSKPGNDDNVIAVGSASNTVFPVMYTAKDSSGREISYASVWPVESAQDMDVYVHELGCGYEDWLNTGAAIQDPSKTIIVAPMSLECPLGQIMALAGYYAGVPYVMAYKTSPDVWSQDPEISIPYMTTGVVVSPATGSDLVSRYKRNGGYLKYKIAFNNPTAKSTKLVTGGMMSNFSSFGPSWDTLQVKPQLAAPGGRILATWPLMAKGGYGIISGTSMATPFAAACYALVKSQYPTLSVMEIRNLLQASAEPIKHVDSQEILSTTAHQGGGMINPYKAIFYESSISPSQLNIGDADTFLDIPYNITIKNKSSRSKTYQISHQGAGYAE